jgi:uncharacterized membrane protein
MLSPFVRPSACASPAGSWTDRLAVWSDAIRTGLWPVPLAMVAVAFGVWGAVSWLDGRIGDAPLGADSWLYSGSGKDAATLLATLVTAIITISSIVFSITIVTLTLAANQFGSRLVRTYMADLPSKLALGLFVMTVVYSLLALRSVQQDMPAAEVPHATVTLALLLGVACVLVLVLFLHNVARSIVADEVIRRVARELEGSIDGLEASPGSCTQPARAQPALAGDGALVRSRKEGYVQAVRYEQLVAAGSRHQATVVLTFRAGAFMCRDDWLARVHPASALTPALAEAIHGTILVGALRTPTQDVEYSMRHLVDVALRALSPGINDANTAMVVIDRLRAAVSELLGKRLPPGRYVDSQGQLRVVVPCHDYAELLGYAFEQIRHAAAPHPAVTVRMLQAFARIAEHARLPEQCDALAEHARRAAEGALASPEGIEADRRQIKRALEDTGQRIAAVRRQLR